MSVQKDPRPHNRGSSLVQSDRKAESSRSIRACTFDCYGTLIDWHAGVEQTLGPALRAHGYSGSGRIFPAYEESEKAVERAYRPYREVLASSAIRTAEKLGVSLPATEAKKFAEGLPAWPAFPDTASVLHELGRQGVRRYILSNVDRDLLQETIRRNHFEVDGIVTAEDVQSYKPAPGHWIRFLQDHPGEEAGLLHVANSLFHDIVPANGLGWRTVWVNRYGEPLPVDIQPAYTIRDLRGLLGLIGKRPRE